MTLLPGYKRKDTGIPRPPIPGRADPAASAARVRREPVSLLLGRNSAILLFAGFIIVFGVIKPNPFLSETTFQITFQQGVVTAIVALAFLVPLIAGIYDLSVGQMMGFSLVIMNWFNSYHPGVPVGLVAVGAIIVCAIVGLFSGLLVVRFRVNSLIATLGVSQVLYALQLRISNNQEMDGTFPNSFANLGLRNVFGVPIVVIYLLVLAIILWFVVEHTPVGRYLIAVGGNPEASRLAGLPVNKLTYGSLAASGAIAGLAGVVFAAMVGVYDSDTGSGLLFPALAAVFFGASQFSRRPNVWGTIVAYFALSFGVKGLEIAFGPGTYWVEPLFQGASLLIAVALASRMIGQTRRSRRAAAVADAVGSTSGSGTVAAEPLTPYEPDVPASVSPSTRSRGPHQARPASEEVAE
jgi:ribose transport system permease protein